MTPRLVSAPLAAFALCALLAPQSGAETEDALSTDVKRLEVRTESCEAIGLEFERRLDEVAARLADAAEAGNGRSESQREEIEQTKVQIDALADCAADLEAFRDQVAERLGEPPEGLEEGAAPAEGDDSLQSLHLRHLIIADRIERLRNQSGEIRDSLMRYINQAELSE